MLGLVLFIMLIYSLVVGSVLYLSVFFLYKSVEGGAREISKWCACVILSYVIIYMLHSHGIPLIR